MVWQILCDCEITLFVCLPKFNGNGPNQHRKQMGQNEGEVRWEKRCLDVPIKSLINTRQPL